LRAPLSSRESERLIALRHYEILDTPPEPEFDDITLLAAHILQTPIALITLVDADRQWFKSRVGYDRSETPFELSFCAHAILEEGIFEVPDTDNDERFRLNDLVTAEPHIRFYAGAPLITSEGYRLGTICALDRVPRKLEISQLRALRSLARQVVALLELRRLNWEQGERNRELALLREISNLLHSCVNFAEASRVVEEYAARLLPGISGQMSLFTKQREMLNSAARWGTEGTGQATFVGEDCWALRRGRLHAVLPGIREVAVCPHLKGAATNYSICVPLTAQGQTIGLLSLASLKGTSEQIAFGPEGSHSVWLVDLLAEHVALALTRIGMREMLRESSIRDVLTGLFNRRYMEETLVREISRVTREAGTLGVILLDLDHFKQVNDKWGHEMGDRVLQSFAQACQAHFRVEDILCRQGGEEFVVILPSANITDVTVRLEQLREKMKMRPLKWEGQELPPVTFSGGVAMFPRHGQTADELIGLADKALYLAKANGRNCIAIAEDLKEPQTVEG
jgi:diguanylate cyclase (GGDEF)-like protein